MSTRQMLVKGIVEVMRTVATRLPIDVYDALVEAREREENTVARRQLDAIIRNADLAATRSRPICQDTGMVYFFTKVGKDFPFLMDLRNVLVEATRESTFEIPLRPNAVDPVHERNSGDNTGRFMPWIDMELVKGDRMELTVLFKGGGSEYPSTLRMIPPIQGLRGVKRVVIDAMYNAGAMPCPPVIVGVGLAGGSDIAMKLAKRALLRSIGVRHPDEMVAKLEEEIMELVNRLEIGPHGFGGPTTALDVKVEYGHRHPASYAVGVTTNCWAVRRGMAEFRPDGSYTVLSRHIEGGE